MQSKLLLSTLSLIYTMKNRCDMLCDKLCDRGNLCRTLSQRLIAKVEPGSTFATWETQVASWALAYHVCFPLVALDLRQNSINRPSLLHVVCRMLQRFFHSINQALFSNWPRRLNLFEKARFLENFRKKTLGFGQHQQIKPG